MAGGGKRGDGRRGATTDAQWRKRRRTDDWSEEPAQATRRGRRPREGTQQGEAGVVPVTTEQHSQLGQTVAGPSHTAPEMGPDAFFSADEPSADMGAPRGPVFRLGPAFDDPMPDIESQGGETLGSSLAVGGSRGGKAAGGG